MTPEQAHSNLAFALMETDQATASEKDLGRSLLWESGLLMPLLGADLAAIENVIPDACSILLPLPFTLAILKTFMLDVERDTPSVLALPEVATLTKP